MPGKLETYHAKRNFSVTPEPRGEVAAPGERLRFVIQKHQARRLHYDFRLELDGTLKSWAVPKGPSLDPAEKRLAVHVEDHPLDYIDFQGEIPARQYGAGHVEVWDTGYWEPLGDPSTGYRSGKLKFRLEGEKLHGGWTLVRTRLQASGDKEQWLLIKESDDDARPQQEYDVTEALSASLPPGTVPRETSSSKRASIPVGKITPAMLSPAELSGAVKKRLPQSLRPQLATLVDSVPTAGDWIYEVKFDGYRMLARIDRGTVTLFTRDGNEWTDKLPKQVAAIEELGWQNAWLDGEIVVLDKQGMPSFQLLQKAFDRKGTSDIVYFVFDLPYCEGYDLRNVPLMERRALLAQILDQHSSPNLRCSQPIDQPAQQLLDSACRLSMEGIIGKRADSIYLGKRSPNWIKLKCRRRQEFVVVGYTEPQGGRLFFGALLLGVHDDQGRLKYAGRVGSGFNQTMLKSLHAELLQREQEKSPLEKLPAGVRRADVHWVRPQLVAEVSFAEWTHDHLLRQAVFHGLRSDKPARQVRREDAVHTARIEAVAAASVPTRETGKKAAAPSRAGAASVRNIRISHADRVIDPGTGLTKLDLVRFYEAIAPHLLPYLKNRPVYLLRCPEGIAGEHFFQKHISKVRIPGVRVLPPEVDPDHDPLMAIDDVEGLIGAAQMGTLELHTCNATADRIDRPDTMIFDLDPGPSLPWQKVVEGARLVKVVLDELGLRSFLKTSGGKGVHLVVPLARRQSWDDITAFSQAVAQHLARTLPQVFSAKMGEKNRIGRIFVDYLRNRQQASTVSPYSVRARPGLPVAVPIDWNELDDIGSGAAWTVDTLPARLSGLDVDPWRDLFKTRQILTAAMKKKLGVAGK